MPQMLTTLPNTPIEHKELKQNGYTIHYFTSGIVGNEAIVFLHPAFVDHRSFERQIVFFAKQYRVITIDMLGHGLSKIEKAKDKLDATVAHINAILALENYPKAHLVGVSMGSLIAQYFALLHPEKVASLTVLGGYDINADNSQIVKAQRLEQLKWIFMAIFSMNSLRKHISTVSVLGKENQSLFYEMSRLFTRKSFLAMTGLEKVLQQRNNIARAYPLMILCGDKDLELAQNAARDWHKKDSTSKHFIIEDASHCANMDKSKEFNSILMEFVNGISYS